ncbi:MAG TPA: hypothetical protein VJR22_06315 [Candidatus Nitrosotalea sp.]|nr:hypothetical protein [Nitrososphaerota archaeon]HKU33441.1 hypothetical protein [Candidatus Nitrosotalea sp.]
MRLSLVLVLGLIFSIGTLQFAHASYSNVSISDPIMVDSTGHTISNYQTGQEIGVQSILTNHGTTNQKFAYMVQVTGNNGETDYFQAFSASMLGNQSFNATQVWIPKAPGTYTVQVFVWDGLASAVPLTNVVEKQITVQG